MILLLLALSSASGLAACNLTFGSVNLDRVESPRNWDGWSEGKTSGRPVDR